MRILIVGSGGREHAIAWKCAQSKRVDKIFCAPGNAGIGQIAECVPITAMEFDKLAAFAKEQKIDLTIIGMDDPLVGGMPYQGRELAFKLGLSGEQNKQFAEIFVKLAQLFIEKDFSLVEVNPLVVTKEGNLICVDAKVGIDDNSLYRHPDLLALRDLSQSDAREAEAEKYQLNYVALEGDIGCMVNGAGLAMGTMDIVKLYGGNPANFLDVGGGATKERVAEAFKIILTDKNVKSVLVNIFGGIVRCDLIAEGVVAAIQEIGVKVPVVVRLEGTNAPQGRAILAESGVNLIAAHSLQEAAQAAVKAAKGE